MSDCGLIPEDKMHRAEVGGVAVVGKGWVFEPRGQNSPAAVSCFQVPKTEEGRTVRGKCRQLESRCGDPS